MTLDLAAFLEGFIAIPEQYNGVFSRLMQDSRQLQPGDIFIACAGLHVDARDFISSAINKGVSAVISEGEHFDLQVLTNKSGERIPHIIFPDLSQQLPFLAARFNHFPSKKLTVVGITGTNGKTSCSCFIANSLSQLGKSCGMIGTLGNGLPGHLIKGEFTTPTPIQLQSLLATLIEQGAGAVALEVSSHGLVLNRVADVDFDIAIFTNLTHDHLDFHGDMQHYGEAKSRLFKMPDLKYAILNADDPFAESLLKVISPNTKIITYSLTDKYFKAHRQIQATKINLDAKGISANILSPWGTGKLSSALFGKFNLSNLLTVLATLCIQGIPFEKALACLSELKTVPGRMQAIREKNQPLVVVDYSHTPDALKQALQALRSHTQGKLWCVFGCGGDRDKTKRPVMATVAEAFAEHVIVTDDNPRHENPVMIVNDILPGFKKQYDSTVKHDRAEAIAYAIAHADANDTILIAGKGHEEYQLIGDVVKHFSDVQCVTTIFANVKKQDETCN